MPNGTIETKASISNDGQTDRHTEKERKIYLACACHENSEKKRKRQRQENTLLIGKFCQPAEKIKAQLATERKEMHETNIKTYYNVFAQ